MLGAPGRDQPGKKVREEDGRLSHASAHSPAACRASTSCPLPQAPRWPQAQPPLLHSRPYSLVLQMPWDPWLSGSHPTPPWSPASFVSYCRRNGEEMALESSRTAAALTQTILYGPSTLCMVTGSLFKASPATRAKVLLRVVLSGSQPSPLCPAAFLSH